MRNESLQILILAVEFGIGVCGSHQQPMHDASSGASNAAPAGRAGGERQNNSGTIDLTTASSVVTHSLAAKLGRAACCY